MSRRLFFGCLLVASARTHRHVGRLGRAADAGRTIGGLQRAANELDRGYIFTDIGRRMRITCAGASPTVHTTR